MMCPYCGEEVPVDSNRCWKCGTDLPEGAGRGAQDELEVPDDDGAPGAGPAPGEPLLCPHCGSPVPKNASRCRECGRAVKEVQSAGGGAGWRWGAWVTVLVIGIGAAFLVVSYSLKSLRKEKPRTPRTEVAQDKLRAQMAAPTPEERKREIWNRLFDRHFVKWSGYVVSREGDATLLFSQKKGGKEAECKVAFLPDEQLEGLKDGGEDIVWYSARLVAYEAIKDKTGALTVVLTLEDGKLEPGPNTKDK